MSEIKDGGPAFPVVSHGSVSDHQFFSGGMTLRDWFAGQALIGVSAELVKHGYPKPEFSHGEIYSISTTAYMIADAMIAEREKR